MQSTVANVALVHVSGAVPARRVTNADLSRDADADYVERLSQQVGVQERRVVTDEQAGSVLAGASLRRALAETGWSAGDLDVLVVVTQTPDRLFPGISSMLHRAFGLPKAAAVFDVNLGCSAYVYGLWLTSTLLAGQARGRAAVITVDTMSRTLGATDTGNRVLFGDGAATTLLEWRPFASDMSFSLSSDGRGTESVCYPDSGMAQNADRRPEFALNGPAVLGLALKVVPQVIAELAAASGVAPQDLDMIIPHQANTFILEKLAGRGATKDVPMLVEMAKTGNTSSASIPLAAVQAAAQGRPPAGRCVALVGFGTGFSWGGALVDFSQTTFGPMDDVLDAVV